MLQEVLIRLDKGNPHLIRDFPTQYLGTSPIVKIYGYPYSISVLETRVNPINSI